MFKQLKFFFISLIYSVKKVSDLFNSQTEGKSHLIHYSVEGESVYNDLLQEQITQDVIELRHKSYVVAEESKKYKYIGNGLTEFNGEQTYNNKTYINDENYQIVTIMDNKLLEEGLHESFKRVDTEDVVGQEYTLKIERNFAPIHRIEGFVNKFVIKRNNINEYKIELYTSLYKNPHNIKQRAFLNNLNKLYDGEIYSNEIIDLKSIEFITYKALDLPDLLRFKFNKLVFNNIIKFDGNYVISFNCSVEIGGENLIEKYMDINTELKYKTKALKNTK